MGVNEIASRIKESLANEPVATFGRRCGIGESLLRKYINGSEPSATNLCKIADAAHVSIEWLATGRGNMQRGAGPAPPQTGSNPPQNAQNTPIQGAQAANQPNSAVFTRRLDAISQLLAAIPEPEAAAVVEEFFSRAKSASELAALRQAVAELRTAQKRA